MTVRGHPFGRRALLGLIAAGAASALAPPLRANGLPIVGVQPLGASIAEAEIAFVRRAVLAFYRLDLRVLPATELPRSAYYPLRHRYRAEKLLRFLDGRRQSDAKRVLGLTGTDISTTKEPYDDWGILGLADLDGPAAVVSTFRTKRRAKNAEHARIRLGKTAVHELGHTFGLPHCTTASCLMEDGGGSVLTTDREYDLCARCRERLVKNGWQLTESNELPWPKAEA